ncbi:MAG: VOC family protein [Actinomycetota bacterium]
MIHGLHHVAIGVTDLGAALAFYTEAFGCTAVFRSHIDGDRADADSVIGITGVAADVVMLRLGDAHLELWEYRSPAPEDRRSPANGLGYPHIAVSVTEIESEVTRLTDLGMSFVGPPVDMGPQKAVYGRDPFGNLIELYEAVE